MKYTVIYTDYIFHAGNVACMKRIEVNENETIQQVLDREGIDERTVFIFQDHSFLVDFDGNCEP